jgi:hypothetical protein
MKNVISFSLATVLFGTLFLASCAKDDNSQTATPTSSDPRAKFLGNWAIQEHSTDYPPPDQTYNVTVTDSSDASHILFAYLYGFNKKIYASVSGTNLTIPQQIIQGQNISGTGVLVNGNQINLSYTVQTSSTHTDNVTAVLTK